MSIGKKLLAQTAGLGEALDKAKGAQAPSSNKSAPAQLMAFRGEMEAYEVKIAELESKLANGLQTEVPVANIEPNPWQPRKVFDPEAIKSLAKSIEETGLIQPVIVRRVPTRDTFQLIAGERRCRAHQYLGKETIKAVIIEASDTELAVMALAENIDRQDLTDFEIAKAIRRIESEFPNKKKLAEAIGVGRSDLYKYLSFEKLPEEIRLQLEVKPELLGRNAAERIAAVLGTQGEEGKVALLKLWPRLVKGELEQGRAADLLEAAFAPKETKNSEKPRQIDIGARNIGSVAKSKSHITIKIKSRELNEDQEAQLLEFVKKLLG